MSSPLKFPSPIGGVPINSDFAPSIIFALAYAAIAIGSFYRLARSASRTLVVTGTLAFVIERVVIFILRAKQARTPSEDTSSGLTIYWQMTFAIGYLSMYADLPPTLHGLRLLIYEDKPRERFWYRRIFGISTILTWVPHIIGMVAEYQYVSAETNAGKASTLQTLRYVTTVICFIFILNLQILAIYGYLTIARIRKSSVIIAFVIASLLNVVSIYRFIAMSNHTTSLTSAAPGSLNTSGAKAAFYIFHALPEFATAAVMLNINVRERFSTGMWGDKSRDAKPKPETA